MKLSKKRIEKMILEFGRGRIFTDYTDEEIFQLGMCKALEILNIEIEEIKEPYRGIHPLLPIPNKLKGANEHVYRNE
ncbi:hypothetical protein L8C07_26455 [Paenibacillus sp. CMAA1739]|uniref:hypothetical protein n=2 Tax=Paenibacillus TaxID=44249 RepID=UPI002DBDB775|nr:hypothetical protein [Paenibacillus sp. CMAA1739]MEC4569482.1 hypothetical protein [Paenibacillus sp. CMAA1739]